jgi:hypothetical protein
MTRRPLPLSPQVCNDRMKFSDSKDHLGRCVSSMPDSVLLVPGRLD